MLIWQLLWAALAYLCGALPFSVWVGRYGLRRDITTVGDRNPGATNVLRAGNFYWFSLALALDISKAAVPVGLAYQIFGWRDWPMLLIAIAPALGHAFSPFLNWRGGKALATLMGCWIGISLWVFSLAGVLLLVVWALLIKNSGWAVFFTQLSLLGWVLWQQADGLIVAFWAAQFLLVLWTHRRDLRQPLQPRFL
jgi:glycerol-3-phosphate acyltransferase PlsY